MKDLKTKLENFYKNKKVLITGHTGFKGSWLCEILLLLGAKIAGVSLAPNTNPSLFEQLEIEKRICHYLIDIRNKDELNKIILDFQPDYVFHLAAQPLVRLSYQKPLETYQTNFMGTVNVLETLRELQIIYKTNNKKCSSVFITTDKCYENKEWESSYRESDEMGGYDPYSSSKGASEIAINAYRRSFMNPEVDILNLKIGVASARAGNVIGGGDWAEDRVVPDSIRFLSENKPIVVRNPSSTRPWQHVLDPLVGYLILAASQKNALENNVQADVVNTCSAFNFGPPLKSNVSVENLINEILKCWPGTWIDISNSNELHEAKKLNLSWDKAYHILNWHPQLTLEESVQYTVNWYKDVLINKLNPHQCTIKDINSYFQNSIL